MVMAAADVNPAVTGIEMNCTRKPRLSSPKPSTTHPTKNADRMANAGPRLATWTCTISDMMAVGPIVTSLQLPNKAYTKHPMKAEYNPYWGSSPATTAYAMPCGITVSPTVNPATRSSTKNCRS